MPHHARVVDGPGPRRLARSGHGRALTVINVRHIVLIAKLVQFDHNTANIKDNSKDIKDTITETQKQKPQLGVIFIKY